MKETDQLQQTARELRAVRVEMENSGKAVRDYLSRVGQIQSAYRLALSGVRQELNQLSHSLTALGAVGLNVFSGLVSAVQPLFSALAEGVTRLFGVTYWRSTGQAAQSAASGLGKAAKATRSVAQAQKDLMSFDQINRLSPAKGSGGSSGASGGGGGFGSGVETGEWVRIPGLLDQWARSAREVLAQIWQPFRSAWEQEGEQVIQAARKGLDQILQAAAAVGKSWLEVWTDGTGEEMVATLLQILQKLCETAGNLAGQFQKAWTKGNAGTAIFRNLAGIVQSVLKHLRDMASATAVWASRLEFSGLVQGFVQVTGALRPLVDVVAGGLKQAYTQVLLPLAKWTVEQAAPAALNLLASAVKLLTAALNLLQPVANAVWNGFLKPIAQWTGAAVVKGVNALSAALKGLASVVNSLPNSWNNLKNKAASIWKSIQNTITGAAGNCRSRVTQQFASMTSDGVTQANSLKNKLSSVFKTIVSSVKSRFSGIKNALTTPFKNGLNAVITLVNRVIRKINSALKFSWPDVKVLGKTIVRRGSVTLARMPTISKLAEGGIAVGPAFSLIGEAGREAVLPLERNTGWMDTLADKLAARAGGSPVTVEVSVGGRTLAREVIRGINEVTHRTGRCPIHV